VKFTLESGGGQNVIRSYSREEIRVGAQSVRSSCILTADSLLTDWGPETLDQLAIEHLEPIFALQPALVLFGTGPQLRFAPSAVRAALLERGIGVESMDLGAACRTYNVLVQEDRRVAAVLFLR